MDESMKRVSEIMDRKLVAVSPNSSIKAAMTLVKKSGVRILLVLENGVLVGVADEEDMEMALDQNEQVRRLMKKPVFVEANDTIANAVGKTMNHNVSRIPVVESASTMKCIGIVTSTDLLKAASKE